MLICVILILLIFELFNATFDDEYRIDTFLNISLQQKIILNAWKIPTGWVNAGMALDPNNKNNVVVIWRMPDRSRRDKIGNR